VPISDDCVAELLTIKLTPIVTETATKLLPDGCAAEELATRVGPCGPGRPRPGARRGNGRVAMGASMAMPVITAVPAS
jgi:hypothetical protein